MPVPSLVLFDMDDVLCDYDRGARAAHLARLAGTTTEAVLAAIWASGLEHQSDAGTIDAQAYLRACGERIGYPLSLEEWVEARRAAMTPRPDVLDLVRRIRTRARVAVLTNNTPLVAEHRDRLFPELRPLFGEDFHTSGGLGLAKPDPACFRRCLSLLGATPAGTLFVDDLAENVAGAEAAGLSAHRYRSVGALAEVLDRHGLI